MFFGNREQKMMKKYSFQYIMGKKAKIKDK